MSGSNGKHIADGARARARLAAAQVSPLARTAGTAAKRGLHSTREWAAPQLERTGQAVQDTIAPKVSAALTSAARKIAPPKPRRRIRWVAVVASSVLAGTGAAVGAILGRKKLNGSHPTDEASAEADGNQSETDVLVDAAEKESVSD